MRINLLRRQCEQDTFSLVYVHLAKKEPSASQPSLVKTNRPRTLPVMEGPETKQPTTVRVCRVMNSHVICGLWHGPPLAAERTPRADSVVLFRRDWSSQNPGSPSGCFVQTVRARIATATDSAALLAMPALGKRVYCADEFGNVSWCGLSPGAKWGIGALHSALSPSSSFDKDSSVANGE